MVPLSCTLFLFMIVSISATPINGIKYIFAFGDSYTTTSFNVNGAKPNAANPLGNPAFPGVITGNGTNWIGHLVGTYNTSETLCYNFAVGGATVDSALVTPNKNALPVTGQVASFVAHVASKPSYAPWQSDNSLFAVWIGINDIGITYNNTGETNLLSQVITKYFEELQILYGYGARNFLLLTVPPMDKTPKFLALPETAQNTEKSLIAIYNGNLEATAAGFQSENLNSTVTVYATEDPFNLAISNPKAYGATNATCVNSDGKTCLWWDVYHPGMAIQKLVAEGVATALKGSFF